VFRLRQLATSTSKNKRIKRMNDFDKSFNRTRNAILCFIAIVFICIISLWIIAGAVIIKSSDQIEQHGLKSIVESVWCGKDNVSCMSK